MKQHILLASKSKYSGSLFFPISQSNTYIIIQRRWKSLKCGCAVYLENPNSSIQNLVFKKRMSPKEWVCSCTPCTPDSTPHPPKIAYTRNFLMIYTYWLKSFWVVFLYFASNKHTKKVQKKKNTKHKT